jgi:hypothetical protein
MGCSEDFIDLAPPSDLNANDFYSSASEFNLAVNATYENLRSGGMYGGLFRPCEMRSDNTFATWVSGSSFDLTSIYTFDVNSANTYIHAWWNDMYEGIMRCNIITDRIGDVDMDETIKKQYIGEASFIRALTYFHLVRLFGDVPLVTQVITVPESYQLGRNPVNDVYEFIIDDLKVAENNLPSSYSGADIGRATNGAAQGLLAKVYLTRNDHANSKIYLEKVIGSDDYLLLPKYEFLWDLQHENSKESLFEVQYKKGGTGTGSPFANNFAPRFSGTAVVQVGGTGSQNAPTDDMEAAYESGDLRKDLSIVWGFIDENSDSIKWKWTNKYWDVPFANNDADNNWSVLRYADILLMYAEVLNEIGFVADGDAFNYLNLIRDRAGLDPITSDNADPAYRAADQQAFRLAIEHERRVELAFENHRWFDLLRTGRALDVMSSKGYTVSDKDLLFPIPLEVIESNPEMIKQNPGY